MVQGQIRWTNVLKGRQLAAEHLILPSEGTSSFQCKHIDRVFHQAKHMRLSLLLIADLAASGRGKETASATVSHVGLYLGERLGQSFRKVHSRFV
jgi:hypothetical protein